MVVLPPPEGPTRAILSPGLTRDVYILQYRHMVVRVLKTYVVKGNGSLYMLHLLCIFTVLDIRHHIHDSWKRSIPVIPRWNCSANSMILRMVVRRVVTYMV